MTEPLARSWLFTPGNRPDRFPKAAASGAEAVILDWEDAVAAADKPLAREATSSWLAAQSIVVPSIWVRVNDRRSQEWATDLAWLGDVTHAGVAGVVLPKTESADDVADTRAYLGDHGLAIVALIETGIGVQNAPLIAAAPGVFTLALGTADLRLDVGLGPDDTVLAYPRSRLAYACRAAGLHPPIDGPEMGLDDIAGTTRSARAARALGMGAKFAVHPAQVNSINAAMGYTDEQRDWARRVLSGAQDVDGAAVRVDGEMVDRPRFALAHRILAQHA
ncbi:CoA ester lyase [Mycolicibacterium wolinskyi]|uniref:HpcH/HpaI aldolase/citrate lyase domain-containing protein n=1 Tax=Mycolicibacterium wolinskyi TaxID=59750 RepID=A0A1X2F242_9MYCO|nr:MULTISPECIES: CoA ester lyase [Mycolicibacterium]MCV7287742.1 CoA ester lyase [Mycolicibacterium wolinskyi]MCV7294640.1 CoA ester lyase [Mycolicibacterium goodii]ORX12487.1 hypothetical protein AWC31_31425 [Mycolicibacterium wolinskyi]